MHIMDKAKKVITIIGLSFEGLSVLSITLTLVLFNKLESFPGVSEELETLSAADLAYFRQTMEWIENVLLISVVIFGIALVVNLFLFSKLITRKYTEEQAKKVYLYQAIWGGINLLSNQVTGILYLISGIGGFNGHKEETDIREGI